MRYPAKPHAGPTEISRAKLCVSTVFGVQPGGILNGRRFDSIMRPRLTLYLILGRFDDKSVCRQLGVHRTTLVHGRRSGRFWADSNPQFKNSVNQAVSMYDHR